MTKYGNKRTRFGDQIYDSRKEAKRSAELHLLERAGEISNLKTQVPFVLIPSQRDENGKLIEKAVTYKADFVYNDKNGKLIVEDVKGYRTDIYKIKRKLMLKVHGIKITET